MSTESPLLLRSDSGSLVIALDETAVGDWCQVHLVVSGTRRALGAERLEYIAMHLALFLADTSPSRRWVLSLSELHTTLYGEHVAGGATFHLQDVDGKTFTELVLTGDEKQQWLETVVAVRRS